jgi:hypothetical protein
VAWQDEMDILLRVMVNDVAGTLYSDDTLEQILVCSGFQVSLEMTFSSLFHADMANIAFTPDPTAAATRDESYINLTCLKAASIVDRGAASIAASQAIAVKDGASLIDLRDVAKHRLNLLKLGWCKVYDDAKLEYRAGQVRIAGAAVMGPFRVYASGGLGMGTGYYVTAPGRDRIGSF